MKRVIQVIENLRGGGAERVTIELHKAFRQAGVDAGIYLLNPAKTQYTLPEGVAQVAAHAVVERLEKEQPDLILAHMQPAAQLLQPLKGAPNLFFVVHTALASRLARKSFWSRFRQRRQLRRLYQGANIVTVSKGVATEITDTLGIDPERIEAIYNPFDFEEIRMRAEAPFQSDYRYILNIGTLNGVKRQDILLRAFARLDSELHLVILGEGRKRQSLERLARKLEIEERVHLPGWVENPYPYLKHAELFTLSSEAEGLSMVLIEALGTGTPAVSTDAPHGPSEILTGPLSHYLARVNDPNDLARKMADALQAYPPISEAYLTPFAAEESVRRYLSLIDCV